MSAMSSDMQAASAPALAAHVRALAEADFSVLMARFGAAGFAVANPAQGVLQITAPAIPAPERRARAPAGSVLLSVGVHGDETGPIEMLAHVLDRLSATPEALAVDLMVVVGNIGAILQGKRFVDVDLNRMFKEPSKRGNFAGCAEAERADVLIRCTAEFFGAAAPGVRRWHMDLHTAIRPSVYPTFAIVPELIVEPGKQATIGWLGDAGIEAVIMNPQSAGTYSYWSAEHHGAAAATVELGRVGVLGQNDMGFFARVMGATDALLRGDQALVLAGREEPHVFKVAQEIVKLSDGFRMNVGKETWNFTAMAAGSEIATDGEKVYRVGEVDELVVFPNPDVRVGMRAGLMVVRET